MNPINQKTMEQLYIDTKKKVKYLKDQGFRVVQKWGCELKKELEEDEGMNQFFLQFFNQIKTKSLTPYSHAMHSTEDVRTRPNYSTSVRATRRLSKY